MTVAVMLVAGLGVCRAEGVTIKAVNSKAEAVFSDIMRQTGKNFIYTPDILRGLRATVSAADEPLDKVLERMFRGSDVTFSIKGKNVILKKRRKKVTRPAVRWATVSGFVRDSATGEPLPGATVYVSTGKTGCSTNAYGFYSLRIPEGEISLSSSCFDYLSESTDRFRLRRDTTIDFSLKLVKQLQEVIVTGSRNRLHTIESPEIGRSSLSASMIKSTPVIFGESDVIKTLQLEPGVSAGVEGLAGMYVHGGNADENMYMLDNIPLYNVNHLGGLFSAFNTDAMRSVDFYKSSFPARYDGRLSSFLDVHTKDGRTDRHHGLFSLGLTSGTVAIDGPIGKNGRTTYSLGLRRSWLDLVLMPVLAVVNVSLTDESFKFRYDYSDLNLKLTHRFSDRSRLSISGYYGEDFFKVNQKIWWTNDLDYKDWECTYNRMHWGNILVNANWNYVVSPKLFAEFTGAYTRYFSRLEHSEKEEYELTWEPVYREGDILKTVNSIDD